MIIEAIVLKVPETSRVLTLMRVNEPHMVHVSVRDIDLVTGQVIQYPNGQEEDGVIDLVDENRANAQIMAVAYRLYSSEPGKMGCGQDELLKLAKLFTLF